MNWFKQTRYFFHQTLLFRKAKVNKIKREFMYLEDAGSIGILYDALNTNELAPIKELYQKLISEKKKVTLIGFMNKKKAEDYSPYNADWKLLTRKGINWIWIPRTIDVDDFINTEFDLLLNVYKEEYLPLEYISALSKARFRVGIKMKNNLHCNDFLLDLKDETTIRNFITQMNHYLLNKQSQNDKKVSHGYSN